MHIQGEAEWMGIPAGLLGTAFRAHSSSPGGYPTKNTRNMPSPAISTPSIQRPCLQEGAVLSICVHAALLLILCFSYQQLPTIGPVTACNFALLSAHADSPPQLSSVVEARKVVLGRNARASTAVRPAGLSCCRLSFFSLPCMFHRMI